MRAIVAVHGIRTDRKRAEAWGAGLQKVLQAVSPEDVGFYLYEYGFLSATAIRFPWVGGMVRRHEVARFQRWVAALAQRLGPDVPIDAIGYSFGSYLVGHSMTDAPGPRTFYRDVVLMGCILSSRDDWSDKTGHYRRALNLYSHGDEVVRFSTFGQAGWCGFQRPPADVQNVDETPCSHGDYEEPGPAWVAASGFLAQG